MINPSLIEMTNARIMLQRNKDIELKSAIGTGKLPLAIGLKRFAG
tara:strand:+ start:121 stop:255 length:135 start_codon:yes stop_codon:yes gene_type:complete